MELEEAIEILKDFAEGKIQQDKLEHYRGSYKMGYFYTKDVQSAINDLLNHLTKQEKMIELMAEELAFGVFDFKNKKQAKQYFEKKIEESE